MILKYWRLLILLVTVLGAVFAIGLKAYPYGRDGVEIIYISGQSPAKSILNQGMVITHVNGKPVTNINDWNAAAANPGKGIAIRANGIENQIDMGNSTALGIEVMNIEKFNLDFGLDMRGGTRIILQPKDRNVSAETIEQVLATLQTRANLYGLREITFTSISGTDGYLIQVEAAGVGRGIVEDLLSSQGRFAAKISKPVALAGNSGQIQLGGDKYPVEALENDTIKVGGKSVGANGTFELKGINFQYINRTKTSLFLMADVLGGKDIEIVFSDPQHSGMSPVQGGSYTFYFTIQVSAEGAQRFADVTSGVPKFVDIYSGDEYLKDCEIFLNLDDKLVSSLRISAELGGQPIQTPQITGSRSTQEDAREEKLRLQTILRSGALPTTLETASVDVISPTLGEGFFASAFNAALLAAAAVAIVIFVRYRKIMVAAPMVLTGLSEVVIILGIASANDGPIWSAVLFANIVIIGAAWWKKQEVDITAWVGAMLIPMLGFMSWTIDLSVIGGIIAAIGTGVDQLIIITDETMSGAKKKLYTMKENIKMAFFIIFGAASTVVAAMLPLMFLGIGLIRGFAITTIIGVLVGILVTRPAYAVIVERMLEKR